MGNAAARPTNLGTTTSLHEIEIAKFVITIISSRPTIYQLGGIMVVRELARLSSAQSLFVLAEGRFEPWIKELLFAVEKDILLRIQEKPLFSRTLQSADRGGSFLFGPLRPMIICTHLSLIHI